MRLRLVKIIDGALPPPDPHGPQTTKGPPPANRQAGPCRFLGSQQTDRYVKYLKKPKSEKQGRPQLAASFI